MKTKNIFLFTPWFMGVLFVVFAMTMAFATFYENDFGAEAAKSMVYNTWWFELIFVLMVVNLSGQIFTYKLYKRKKLTVLIFHVAFVIIIIGAAITRYFGVEGVVHIREGKTQNMYTTVDQYLKFKVNDQQGNTLFSDSEKMTINSVKNPRYKESAEIGGIEYSLKLKEYLPNAMQTVINHPDGTPVVSMVVSRGMMGGQTLFLTQGEIKTVDGISFGFVNDDTVDVRIMLNDGEYSMESRFKINEMAMRAQQGTVYEKGEKVALEKMTVYKINGYSVVPEILSPSGSVKPVAVDFKRQRTNKSVLIFDLKYGNKSREFYLWRGPEFDNKAEFLNGNHQVQVTYGAFQEELPFSLKLEDFILDRYPGSSSPSSYKSNVVLIDKENNVNKPYSIYMNHILKYQGWRFYQSSYDRDEQGTILSINRDFWGMTITYVGYFLLFLFILLSMLNKKSSFRSATRNMFKSNVAKTVVLLILFAGFSGIAQAQQQKLVVGKEQANEFGRILVQDQKGRTEPLYTLSSDILRKVARDTKIEGYNSMQVFLGIYFDFQNWRNVPLIKISNAEVKRLIGVKGNYAAFSDIVDMRTNSYKLAQSVNVAYEKPAAARNKFDKEIIKVDERINIIYMIYLGEFMKIFPVNDPDFKWYPPQEAHKFANNTEDSLYLRNIVDLFADGIRKGDYSQADEVLQSIVTYQRKFAQYELPGELKVSAEVFYYKANIYNRLFPFYATLGFLLLFILIYGIIAQKKEQRKIVKIFAGLIAIGFLFHTLGLAIRWYVSGHAPMSNGFESLIFISWVTILAGFIFVKRSAFVLAATAVLGGFTLLVAHLSFMDPEITNLVPVLQSYWLTLHVSVIISSYGFFGLGAILGIIVLVLYALISPQNKSNILNTIEELTVINYKSLTIGLYLLTIGTFLGAIWANESWGRYWGWDPKETWSLITIIVYSFIVHSRLIEGLKGFFAFNVLALFGFSSVLMTYFGVNYYLSGLHSYAGGDPVPVPNFVYVSVVALVALTFAALWKKRKMAADH